MALDSADALLASMANQLEAQLNERGIDKPAMVGIHTGGVWVANKLHEKLGIEDPLGTLDISFYRDDFSQIGMSPQVKPSTLPFAVDDRHIILVDDVLYTGRTVRAALNELFDYGRPASVILAVMAVRSGHEIPICADIAGDRLTLDAGQQIKLKGPDPLNIAIVEVTDD